MMRIKLNYYQKMPENTKNVTRVSRWGNPFKLIKHGGTYSLMKSLYEYECWLRKQLKNNPDFLKPLIGFNLGCYCNLDSLCHADILLEYLKG